MELLEYVELEPLFSFEMNIRSFECKNVTNNVRQEWNINWAFETQKSSQILKLALKSQTWRAARALAF